MSEQFGLSITWLKLFAKKNKARLKGKSSLQVYETILKPSLSQKCVSYIDFLLSDGNNHTEVDRATSFVSHEWTCSFIELLATLDDWCQRQSMVAESQGSSASAREHFLWIDIFASAQLLNANTETCYSELHNPAKTMPEISHAIIVCSPLPYPRYLQNPRCRLELHAAHAAGLRIAALLPRAYRNAVLAGMRATGDIPDPIAATLPDDDDGGESDNRDENRAAADANGDAGSPAAAAAVDAVLRGLAVQLALEAADPDSAPPGAGPDPDCRIQLLCGAGGLLWAMGQADEARAAYAACLADWDAGRGGCEADSEEVGALVTRNRLAVACARMGRDADARDLFARGAAARRVRIGEVLAVTGEGGSLHGWLRQPPPPGSGPFTAAVLRYEESLLDMSRELGPPPGAKSEPPPAPPSSHLPSLPTPPARGKGGK
jgi:hypothetical protein